MTSKELIEAAGNGYQDGGLLLEYSDQPDEDCGDTLVRFLVYALLRTHDETHDDDCQLTHAIGVIETAISDLYSVKSALEEKQDDVQSAAVR